MNKRKLQALRKYIINRKRPLDMNQWIDRLKSDALFEGKPISCSTAACLWGGFVLDTKPKGMRAKFKENLYSFGGMFDLAADYFDITYEESHELFGVCEDIPTTKKQLLERLDRLEGKI